MIRIVFIDHHNEFRHRICRALSLESDFEISGIGKDGYDAISMIKKHKPDVALLDMELPDFDGFQAGPILKHSSQATEIIVLTDDVSALKKEIYFTYISGYLTRAASVDLICQAVRTVRYGGRFMAPEIAAWIGALPLSFPKDTSLLKDFSPGELELIRCIGRGMTNREIAETLYLAEGTIRNRISSVLQKTGLHDRTQVALYAARAGL